MLMRSGWPGGAGAESTPARRSDGPDVLGQFPVEIPTAQLVNIARLSLVARCVGGGTFC